VVPAAEVELGGETFKKLRFFVIADRKRQLSCGSGSQAHRNGCKFGKSLCLRIRRRRNLIQART
jgi:hypothetical protein